MKTSLKMLFAGIILTSGTACAGTGNFVVPPCTAPDVISSATALAQSKSMVNPRTVRLYNIRNLTYRPNNLRTCLATIKDRRGRDVDFFYQVKMTHGIKWVVDGVDL